MMSATQDIFPLDAVAIDWLQRGEAERFEFHPRGKQALELALKALFDSDMDPRPALDRLVGLAATLHETRGSPMASRLIMEVLLKSPKASRVLKIGDGHERYIAEGKQFLSGSQERRRAPRFGALAPNGTVRMSNLVPRERLIPGGRLR